MDPYYLMEHIEKESSYNLKNAAKAAKNAADRAKAAASEAKLNVNDPSARKQAVEKAHFFASMSIVNASYVFAVGNHYHQARKLITKYGDNLIVQYCFDAILAAKTCAQEAVKDYEKLAQAGDEEINTIHLEYFGLR